MKKTLLISFVLGLLTLTSFAQQKRGKMAIFTPLYLDEAFDDGGNYKFDKKTFPKKSIQGLEFYQGASIAIDSLKNTNANLDIYIYDSKPAKISLEQQFTKAVEEGMQLIIANATIEELNKLAPLAYKNKVVLINANVPNDANVTNNPFYVVVNPTLQTLVEKIYQKLAKEHTGKTVFLVSRADNKTDKMIADALLKWNTLNKKNPVNFKSVLWKDSLNSKSFITQLQGEKKATIVTASIDAAFGEKTMKSFSALTKQVPDISIYGFPTWENIDFSKKDYKGLNIVFSTPFYNDNSSAASKNIYTYYNKIMHARPSDLVFRAFAITYKYGRLLSQFNEQFITNMNSKEFVRIYDFDIQPVLKNGLFNYFENKNLYFLHYHDGVLKKVE